MKTSQTSSVQPSLRNTVLRASQNLNLLIQILQIYTVSQEIPEIFYINSWHFQAWFPYSHSLTFATCKHTEQSPHPPPPPRSDTFLKAEKCNVFPDFKDFFKRFPDI